MNKGFVIYVSIIAFFCACFITFNHFFAPPLAPWFDDFPLWFNILGVLGSTVAVIALDGAIAHICHKYQNRFDPFSRFFEVSKKQKTVLGNLGIKKIKNFLPDLGVLVKFPKDKIVDPKSKEYVYTYIVESCSGELGHLLGAFLGFLIVFIFPPGIFPLWIWLRFGVPVALVNFVLCILPPLALRYNRYGLAQIYQRLVLRENRQTETPKTAPENKE